MDKFFYFNYIRKLNICLQCRHAHRFVSCGSLQLKDAGKMVQIRGNLAYKRMGAFAVLRDATGKTQIVLTKNDKSGAQYLNDVPYESYIEVIGEVQKRPENQVNKDMKTGEIEIRASKFTVINYAKPKLPFYISKIKPTESLGLKHRYLDLRQEYLQKNLRLKSHVGKRMRDFLQDEMNFVELTTPTLSSHTPGGAHEFRVLTDHPSEVYSLVQSPQVFKQLAMVAGFEKYFQFATCYRNESGRSDRQPEFMQLDLEMSNVTMNDVMSLVEELLIFSFPFSTSSSFSLPSIPFPKMAYKDAMGLYGCDKPDVRFDWKLVNLTSDLSCFSIPTSEALKLPNSRIAVFVIPKGQKHITRKVNDHWQILSKVEFSLPGVMLLQVKGRNTPNGGGSEEKLILTGPLMKKFPYEAQICIIEKTKAQIGDVIVMAVGEETKVLGLLGKLRVLAANVLEENGIEVRKEGLHFLWIKDFPLFEKDDKTGQLTAIHHPFTAPTEGQEDAIFSNPLQVSSQHYDLVLNGCEIAGGSIRIHEAELQKRILQDILQLDTYPLRFLLEALQCGAPPHGGIALGFDRYISLLCGSKSIREVIAFPKSLTGRCLMTGAPSKVESFSNAS